MSLRFLLSPLVVLTTLTAACLGGAVGTFAGGHACYSSGYEKGQGKILAFNDQSDGYAVSRKDAEMRDLPTPWYCR